MRGRRVSIFSAFTLGFVCLLTQPVAAQPSMVGSFMVGDGPSYELNPPVYTCLETCALLFGGEAAEYACSTSDQEIDHSAWLDGWGDPWSYCTDVPGPENFKAGGNYNDCTEPGCAYTAYVADHFCGGPNFCWRGDVVDPPTGVCGDGAMRLRIAEQYIQQFGNLAKKGNTFVVPANLSDLAGMLTLASTVLRDGSVSPTSR